MALIHQDCRPGMCRGVCACVWERRGGEVGTKKCSLANKGLGPGESHRVSSSCYVTLCLCLSIIQGDEGLWPGDVDSEVKSRLLMVLDAALSTLSPLTPPPMYLQEAQYEGNMYIHQTKYNKVPSLHSHSWQHGTECPRTIQKRQFSQHVPSGDTPTFKVVSDLHITSSSSTPLHIRP